MKTGSDWKSPLMLLLTATIWGVSFVAQSVGLDYVGPFTFNGVRSLLGAAVLLPVIYFLRSGRKGEGCQEAWDTQSTEQLQAHAQSTEQLQAHNQSMEQQGGQTGKKQAESLRTLWLGGVLCGLCLCAASSLQQIGIQYTTAGKAGFLTAMYIIIVPVLGLFFRKKCSPFVGFSILLATVGLYLLSIKDGFQVGTGDIYVMICAVVFAIHILVIDYFAPKCDGVKLSCIQFLVCGIICTVIAFFTETPELSRIWAARLPIAYAGVMSCGVAYTLQIIGQKGMNPTVASLILSLESVISVLAGWIILHEALSARELTGCVIMFVAIVLAQLPGKTPGGIPS